MSKRSTCLGMSRFKPALGFVVAGLACVAPYLSEAQSPLPLKWLYSAVSPAANLAYSPDGKLIAVGGRGGVQICDASTGTLLKCIPTNASTSASVAFSPDSQIVAVGGNGGFNGSSCVVELWNVSSATLLKSFATTANLSIKSIAFSSDGTTIADGGQIQIAKAINGSGVLEIWNVSNGKLLHAIHPKTTDIYSISFSPDGSKLASAANNNGLPVLQIWNAKTGTLNRVLPTANTNMLSSVAFSPDGKTLADGAIPVRNEAFVELWNASTGARITKLQTTLTTISNLAFSPSGKYLADCGNARQTGTVELWNLSTRALTWKPSDANFVNGVAFSPDGTTLTCSTRVGTLEFRDAKTAVLNSSISTASYFNVGPLAFSPDGTTLADGGQNNPQNGVLEFRSVASGAQFATLPTAANSAITSIAFSSDGKTLASAGVSNLKGAVLELWNYPSGTLRTGLATTAASISAVAFSPDGQTLAVAGSKNLNHVSVGLIELWNASTGSLIGTLPTAANSVGSIVFSPDGKTVADGGSTATIGGSGVLETWNLATGSLVSSFNTGAQYISSLAYSSDGTKLAVGGLKLDSKGFGVGILELWQPSISKLLGSSKSVSGSYRVNQVAFSKDDTLLFAGTDVHLQVISVSSLTQITSYLPVGAGSVALSPGGSLLAYTTAAGWIAVSPNPYNAVAPSGISLSASDFIGGYALTGQVTLAQPAPPGGAVIGILSSNPAIVPDTSAFVKAGATTGAFTLNPVVVQSPIVVTLTAGSGAGAPTATLTVDTPPYLVGLGFGPAEVRGGTPVTAYIGLSGPAPTGGVVVSVSCDQASAQVPPTVTIPAGKTNWSFTINTTAVGAKTNVTVTIGSKGKSVVGNFILDK